MNPEEFVRILDTFEQDFASAAEKAKRLIRLSGTVIARSKNPVPTSNLCGIYKIRASNPDLRLAMRRQDDQVAQLAARFLNERWYVHIVKNVRPLMTIFSNEEGIGRACIDFEAQ